MKMSHRDSSARSRSLHQNRRQALQSAIRGALPLGLVAFLGAGASLTAKGQTFYQGDGIGAPVGGSGLWDLTLPRFTTDPTGATYTNEKFGQFDDLVFGPAGG